MSVLKQTIDSVNAVLTVKIGKEDYQEKVEQSLKDIRKKANVPGFRPGMVPKGLIQKMYGKSVLAEQINKLVSESLYTYIQENKLPILGEPLPSEKEDKQIDFDKDEVFEFPFEIGLAPEINVALTADDKVKYYNIEVTDDMVDKQVKAYTARTGKNVILDGPSQDKDMIRGNLIELGKEDGLKLENVIVMASYMSDEDEKKKFDAVVKDQEIIFNPAKAYANNEQEIRYLLHLAKDADVKQYTSDFSFKVTEISRFEDGELNQELFDTVFGKDTVKTEEEFRAKVKDALAVQTAPESDYKFLLDARNMLIAKAGTLVFPDAFLKKYILLSGEGKKEEDVEKEYPKTIEGLTWQLIKEKIVRENELKVDDADLKDYAKKMAQAQFAQYGMPTVADDMLDNYAEEMLKDKKSVNNIVDRALEEKIIESLKSKVTLEKETISMEEFGKFFETEQN